VACPSPRRARRAAASPILFGPAGVENCFSRSYLRAAASRSLFYYFVHILFVSHANRVSNRVYASVEETHSGEREAFPRVPTTSLALPPMPFQDARQLPRDWAHVSRSPHVLFLFPSNLGPGSSHLCRLGSVDEQSDEAPDWHITAQERLAAQTNFGRCTQPFKLPRCHVATREREEKHLPGLSSPVPCICTSFIPSTLPKSHPMARGPNTPGSSGAES